MMRYKIKHKDPCLDNNEFDIEPFNYLFNKSTVYLEAAFVTENQNRLLYVLSNAYKKDPVSIEMLHYCNDVI